MKKIFLYGLFLSVSLTFFGEVNGDGVLAIVNGEAITYFDVLSYNRYIEIQLQGRLKGKDLEKAIMESRKNAVDEFVAQKIFLSEFEEKGFKVPNIFIEERIDNMILENNGGDRVAFIKMLEEDGDNLENHRKKVHDRVAVMMMLNQFVYNKIKISEDEINDYIKENKANFIKKGRVKLAILLVKKDNLEKLELVKNELKSDKVFAEIVTEFSDGPLVKKGGELGWIENSNLRKECKKEILDKKAEENTEIIELPEGFAVFRILEKEEPQEFEEKKMREVAISVLKKEKEEIAHNDYLKKLEKRNIIKKYY